MPTDVQNMADNTTVLADIKSGSKVKLVRVNAGQGLKTRLASMAVRPGSELTVVYNHHPGPVMIIVKDCKLMLGKGIAEKLSVLLLDE